MSEQLDPYHRWLGIAPEEQPANHYRLLGLKQFEADADVIESAADRQMAHVRGFQSGKHSADAQRVLNEISAAKLVLLKPDEKATYDAQLNAQQTPPKKVREPKMAQALPLEQPAPSVVTAATQPQSPAKVPIKPQSTAKKSAPPFNLMFVAIPAAIFFLLIGGTVAYRVLPWGGDDVTARNDDENNRAEVVTPPIVTTSNHPNSNPIEKPEPEPGDAVPPDDNTPNQTPDIVDPEPPIPVENVEPAGLDDGELVAVSPVAQPPVATGPKKHAVPGKAARDAARAKIDSIFSLEEADTRAKKAALAQQLLKVAGDTKDDSVAQFVLLNMARELAAENAQARLAMQAVDQLQTNFDFDTTAVRMATLGAAVKSPVAPTEKHEVLAVGIEMIDVQMLRDEYEAAGNLSVALLDIARRARNKELLDALIQRRTRAAELLTAYTQAKAAIATLKSDPDNADANLTAGRFYLFAKSDWGRALPLLAKGSDKQFAAAAAAEIQKPGTTEQEEKLANTWWALAESQSDNASQQLLQSRAMAWYQRAAPSLNGLAKAAAQQRLSQLADAGIRPLDLIVQSGAKVPAQRDIDLLSGIDPDEDSFNGQWRIQNGKLFSPIAKHSRCRIPFAPPPEYRIDMEVEPLAANSKTLVLGLVTKGPRKFAAVIDGWGKKTAGLEFVDGKQCFENETRFVGPVLVANEKNRISCTVRPSGVVLAVNDREIVNWKGDPSRLSMEEKWDVPDESALSVGAYESSFIIHSMKLTPLNLPVPDANPTSVVEVEDASLVAHWTFDDGRGAVARDSAGGHHGTIKGGTWIRGIRGNALSFDGKDDMVEIPLADALNVSGRITLSAWVRARSLRTKQDQHNSFTSIIDQADKDGATFLRYIDQGEGPKYSTGAYQPGKHTHQALSTVANTDVGQWVHLVGVYDGSAWRLYRNGRQMAIQQTDLGGRGRPANWRIGGPGAPDQPFFFHGDIDDVRIYNRVLSVEEVIALTQPDLRTLLAERSWKRYVYRDGKLEGSPSVFTFNADGSCLGKNGDFVSGVKSWTLEGDVLILDGGTQLRFVKGKFRGAHDSGEWVFSPQ